MCLFADGEGGTAGILASVSSPSLAEAPRVLEKRCSEAQRGTLHRLQEQGSSSFGVQRVLWVPTGRHHSVTGSAGSKGLRAEHRQR